MNRAFAESPVRVARWTGGGGGLREADQRTEYPRRQVSILANRAIAQLPDRHAEFADGLPAREREMEFGQEPSHEGRFCY